MIFDRAVAMPRVVGGPSDRSAWIVVLDDNRAQFVNRQPGLPRPLELPVARPIHQM
jgi:hypothetical protein